MQEKSFRVGQGKMALEECFLRLEEWETEVEWKE